MGVPKTQTSPLGKDSGDADGDQRGVIRVPRFNSIR